MERHEGSKIIAVVPNGLRKNLTFDTGLLQLMQNANGDQLIEVSDVEAKVHMSEWVEEAQRQANEMTRKLQEGFEGFAKGQVIVLDSFSAVSPMHALYQQLDEQFSRELVEFMDEPPKTRAEIERERQKERKEFHKFVNSRRGRGKRR